MQSVEEDNARSSVRRRNGLSRPLVSFIQVMPNKLKVKVEAIYKDDKEVQASQSGENLRLRVSPGKYLGRESRGEWSVLSSFHYHDPVTIHCDIVFRNCHHT